MKYQAQFQMSTTDMFGLVSPWMLLQEVNDCTGREFERDGVGIVRMIEELGATWMMGQLVMENFSPLHPGMKVEIEMPPRELHGVGVIRRAHLRDGELECARVTIKMLPVYFASRKVVPPEELNGLWRTPDRSAGEKVGWVHLPVNMELAERILVQRHMCDVNGHMTAFQYLNYICETAGYWGEELHLIRRLQTDFKAEFLPGEVLELYRGEENGIIFLSGMHEDGRVGFRASVEFDPKCTPTAREWMYEMGK